MFAHDLSLPTTCVCPRLVFAHELLSTIFLGLAHVLLRPMLFGPRRSPCCFRLRVSKWAGAYLLFDFPFLAFAFCPSGFALERAPCYGPFCLRFPWPYSLGLIFGFRLGSF